MFLMLAHLKREKTDRDRENEKKKLHLSLVNFEFLLLLECAVQLLTADNRENVSLSPPPEKFEEIL